MRHFTGLLAVLVALSQPAAVRAVCAPGTYNDGSSCPNCPPGKYQDAEGATSCANCPSGRYGNSAGMQICKSCPKGQSQAFEEQTSSSACTMCQAGQYASQFAQQACKFCAADKYNEAQGSTQGPQCASTCSRCPKGQERLECKASPGKCSKCAGGKFKAELGFSSTMCEGCAQGSYQDAEGQLSCKACAVGMYAGTTGLPVCKSCERGKWATASASACSWQAVIVLDSTVITYEESQSAVKLSSELGLTISDADSTQLQSARVSFVGSFDATDVLELVSEAGNITPASSYDTVSGRLTMTGVGSIAEYEKLLRAVTFKSNSAKPSTTDRSVQFLVTDAEGMDSTLDAAVSKPPLRTIKVVSVNNTPLLRYMANGVQQAGDTMTYNENDGEKLVQPDKLWITDLDDVNMESAKVEIIANYQQSEDTLTFADTSKITGTWDSNFGVLTLFGTATNDEYRMALESVKYSNPLQAPSPLPRKVQISVNDGEENSPGGNGITTINVINVNDIPVLQITATDAPAVYKENDAPVALVKSVTISDADDTLLSFATVKFSGTLGVGFDQFDVLTMGESSGLLAVYAPVDGTLTISGNQPQNAYASALTLVKYSSASENPLSGTRSVLFSVSDGKGGSAPVTAIPVSVSRVNDKPTLDGGVGWGTNILYRENDPAKVLMENLVLTDKDSAKLESATVTIKSGLSVDTDALKMKYPDTHYYSRNLKTLYEKEKGRLSITGMGAGANRFVDTTEFQEALRQVQFMVSSELPSEAVRQFEVVVSDGTEASDPIIRNIQVVQKNDAPVLTGAPLAERNVTNIGLAVEVAPEISIADLDTSTIASATIRIAPYTVGEDVLLLDGMFMLLTKDGVATIGGIGGAISLSAMRTKLRGLSYMYTLCNVPETSSKSVGRTITITVSDGIDDSASISVPLNVLRPRWGVKIDIVSGETDSVYFYQKLKQGMPLTVRWDATGTPPDQGFGLFLVKGQDLVNATSVYGGGRLAPWQYATKKAQDGSQGEGSVTYQLGTDLTIGVNFKVQATAQHRPQCAIGMSAQLAIECEQYRTGLTCRGCEVGFYQDPDNANKCLPCGAHETTLDKSPGKTRTACYCNPDFFKDGGWDSVGRKSSIVMASLACTPCPRGATCNGIAGTCDSPPCHSPPIADPGFWSSKYAPAQVMECKPALACKGGQRLQTDASDDTACAVGYVSQACSICDSDYYRINGQCKACPENGWVLLVFYGAGFMLLSAVIHFVYRRHAQLFSLMMPSITITTNYFQVLANFANFEFWPSPLSDIFEWMSVTNLNLDIVSPECVGVDYETKWLMVQGLPVMSVVSLVGAVVVQYGRTFIKNAMLLKWREAPHEALTAVQDWVREGKLSVKVGSTLVLLDAIYLQVCAKLFEIFDCKEQFPGHFVLEAEPRHYCAVFWPGDPDPPTEGAESRDLVHAALLPWGFFFLIANVFGIPILFARVLFWTRAGEDGGAAVSVTKATQQRFADYRKYSVMEFEDPVQLTYGVIYERFNPGQWYWILVLLVKEVCLVLCGVMFTSYVNFKLAVMCMVLFLAYTVQLIYNPYINVNDSAKSSHLSDYNKLEARLLGICIMILLSGFVFRSATAEIKSRHKDDFVNVLVMFMTILICTSKIYVGAVITRELTRALKLHNYRRKSIAMGMSSDQMRNPLQLDGGMSIGDANSLTQSKTDAARRLEQENKKLKKQIDELLRKDLANASKPEDKKRALTAMQGMNQPRGSVGVRKASEAIKKKSAAAAELPVKTFEAFTLDDPTDQFPEEVEFHVTVGGIEVKKAGSKAAVDQWEWMKLSDFSAEVTKDEEYPDEMDIFRLKVEGDDMGEFGFECDDANAILKVCEKYSLAASEAPQSVVASSVQGDGSNGAGSGTTRDAEALATDMAEADDALLAGVLEASKVDEDVLDLFQDPVDEEDDTTPSDAVGRSRKSGGTKKGKRSSAAKDPARTDGNESDDADKQGKGGDLDEPEKQFERARGRTKTAPTKRRKSITAADVDVDSSARLGSLAFECFTFDVPPKYADFPDDVLLDLNAAGVDVVDADTSEVRMTWSWGQVTKYELKSEGVGKNGMDVFTVRIKGLGLFSFEAKRGTGADVIAALTKQQALAPAVVPSPEEDVLARNLASGARTAAGGRRKTGVNLDDLFAAEPPAAPVAGRRANAGGGRRMSVNLDDVMAAEVGAAPAGMNAGMFRVKGGKARPVGTPAAATATGGSALPRKARKVEGAALFQAGAEKVIAANNFAGGSSAARRRASQVPDETGAPTLKQRHVSAPSGRAGATPRKREGAVPGKAEMDAVIDVRKKSGIDASMRML